MDNNNNFNVVLSLQGPTGPKGDKGDPGYLVFEIQGNNLIIKQNVDSGLTFVIVNNQLIMEVN